MTKKERERRREYIAVANEVLHAQAVDKALQDNPDIRKKIEQLRQARSHTEGRKVSFSEMFIKVAGFGAKYLHGKLRAEELIRKMRDKTVDMCPCGQPLHYSSTENQAAVERLIAELGDRIRVSVGGRTWLVPRHYIALHGLKARELPTLGFEEVSEPTS